MANEFKVKNGLIVIGDLTTSGTITINGALAATQSWVTSQAYLTSASLSGYATQSYVTSAISALIDAAPAALDTLNELAAALGDDASFSTTVTNSIAGKVAKSGDTMTGSLTFASTADNVRLQKNSSFLNLRDPYNNIHLYNAGDGTYIDANVHHWRSQGASYWMTLNGTGLGIGTGSPGSKLTVYSDTTADGILVDVLSRPRITLRDRGNSDTIIGTGDYGLDDFFIDTYSGNAFAIKGSTRNVGIGTTSPNYKLDVNGSINIYTGNSLRWGSGDAEIINSGYNLLFKTYNGSALAEAMRINSAGKVSIGTTDTNSDKSDFTVYTGGNTSIALAGNLFRVGEGDINWDIALRQNGFLETYAQPLYLRTIAGSQPVVIGPNGTNTVEFYPDYTLFNGLNLAISRTNSTHGATNYFRGDASHLVIGTGGTLYLNYGGSATNITGNVTITGGIGQNNLVGRPYAVWGAGGTTTGAVVIKFPGNTSNYGMVHAVIDIYEYSGNHVSTVIVGGHNWGGSQWYNYGANLVGQTDKQVRVAIVDGAYAIVIGDNSSSWSYGQVVLRKIQNGSYYANAMNVSEGYTITQTASLSPAWISGDLRQLTVSGVITASGGNSNNWNTAYSWGNHASAGYLTSVPAQSWASITGKPYLLTLNYDQGSAWAGNTGGSGRNLVASFHGLSGNSVITFGSGNGDLNISVDGNVYVNEGQDILASRVWVTSQSYITSSGSISGNAATATTFSTNRSNYRTVTDNAVAGQLMWKNYGNGHTIFDASNGTSPDGGSINNTNAQVAWTGTYPTLMGWNGSNTYGVRVDSARVADSATTANTAGALTSMNISQFTNNSGYFASGSYSWTSPVFGQYGIKSNLIDNVLYSAADRFEVFRDGAAWNTNCLFNLNYDQNCDVIAVNTSRTYSIILNTKGNGASGITYTEGNIYLSFYYVFIPGSVSGRVKDQNGVWRNIDGWTNVANNGSYAVWRGNVPTFNYMVEMEITINANSSNDVWFAQWEYVMGRPGQYELGIFNKAQDNSVWRSLYFLDSSNVARVTINSGGISANTVTSNNFNVSNAIYFGGGNNYLNWTNGRIYSNVGIESGDSLRAPIFYDSQDSNYYADFNSTVNNAIRVRGGMLMGPNPTWGAYLQVGGDGNNSSYATMSVTNGNIHIDPKNGYNLYLNHYYGSKIYFGSGGSAGGSNHHSNFSGGGNLNLGGGESDASYRLQVNGTGYASSDFRAPIFYDAADTNYYLDPNSTSVLNRVYTTGRLEVTYNVDRYQMNFLRSSGSNWWVTNDSSALGLHVNNVGDRFYFSTGGDFYSDTNGWLSSALAAKQNAATAINTSNIGSQSVNYATSAGYAGYVNNQAGQLVTYDNRTISPSETNAGYLQFGFTSWTNDNNAPYADYLHLRSYTDGSGGNDNLVMFLKSGIGMRIYQQTFGSATAYSSYADVWTTANFTSTNVSNWNTAYGWGNHASQSYATTSYVTTQINNLINGAPGALDTLSELASALGNDASFATTVTNSIASKLSLSGGTMTGQILFQTSALNNGFRWDVNSDAAGITFKNTGDGDNNSYFNFFTEDNGNEYFKFSHNTWNIGSFDFMDVKNGVVRTNGNIYVNASQSGTRSAGTNELINGNRVWHDGDFSSSNISNWNTAYGWGDHASVGYALNSSLANYLPLSGGVIGGAVTINGNLTVNGTITENSSIKLKENVETSEGNLEKVVNLRPVTYNKIGSETTELGLIAEEVAEVYPEFVQYDENGEPVGVHYSRLTAALIGAVKELNEQLQELKRNK